MAEPTTETHDPTSDTLPTAHTDNGGAGSGATDPGEGGARTGSTSDTPIWTRLGYQSPEELEQTHTRYKQQNEGSRTEAQRLQRELQAERDRVQRYESVLLQSRAPDSANGAGATTQYRNHTEAYQAFLAGDDQALTNYESQLQRHNQAAIQQAIVSNLQQITRPAQYGQMVLARYPDMDKPDTQLYKDVFARYDTYAQDPSYRVLYQDDQAAVRDMPSPEGGIPKKMDLRLLLHVAADVAKDHAREEGRREEAKRRAATGGDSGQARGAARAPSEPSAWEQLTDADRRGIEDMVAKGVTPPGWPQVADQTKRKVAFAKHIVARRKKREEATEG